MIWLVAATFSIIAILLFALLAFIGLFELDKDPPCNTCIGKCNEGRDCPNKNA